LSKTKETAMCRHQQAIDGIVRYLTLPLPELNRDSPPYRFSASNNGDLRRYGGGAIEDAAKSPNAAGKANE